MAQACTGEGRGARAAKSSPPGREKEGAGVKVILDCHIGPNIDDAFALALALAAPEIELVGVTTEDDAGGTRARTAAALARAYGRADVPIIAGVNGPLTRSAPRECPAVRFLVEQAKCHPGDIVVVTTGPATNLALALRETFPGSSGVRRFRAVVAMAGWMGQRLPEWNVQYDPVAMDTLLQSDEDLWLFGLDVTLACRLNEMDLALLEEAKSTGTQLLLQLLREWQAGRPDAPILHDPLPVAYLCDPQLATMESARVAMTETPATVPDSGLGGRSERVLAFDASGGRPVKVCRHVDVKRYFAVMIQRLLFPRVSPLSGRQMDQTVSGVTGLGRSLRSLPTPELYNALELSYRPGWDSGWQSRAEHQVILIEEGTITVEIANHSEPAYGQPQDALFVPRDTSYRLSTRTGARLIEVFFYMNEENDLITSRLRRAGVLVHARQQGALPTVMRGLVQAHTTQTFHSLLTSQGLLYQLLALLSQAANQSHWADGNPERDACLERARFFVEEHITRNLSLAEVARVANMSKYHFNRLFRRRYGVTPLGYHTHLRMQRAEALLELGKLPVCEVAEQLGYASVYSFSRSFKRYFGRSPTAPRRRSAGTAPARGPGGGWSSPGDARDNRKLPGPAGDG